LSVIPTLTTARLTLRPMTLADAPRVQLLAGDRQVAATTALIPHPYPDGAAEVWIGQHERNALSHNYTFAITLNPTGELIGCIGLSTDATNQRSELGYWLGVPFWGRGYVTEAARAVVDFAFTQIPNLHKISACHLGNNPASGRVMQKIGMTREGVRRDHRCKWGEYHDEVDYGLLRTDWQPLAGSNI
jgi:ribosomal-protein-alanine N-acetyltransferase